MHHEDDRKHFFSMEFPYWSFLFGVRLSVNIRNLQCVLTWIKFCVHTAIDKI